MSRILFFAQARDAAGCAEIEWHNPGGETAEILWDWLVCTFPDLGSVQTGARLARNGCYLSDGESFGAEDEIAVIPPVSGG